MTGFGTVSELVDGCRYVVEVRAVNGRYMKCNVRLPEELQGLEPRLEEVVGKSINRGSVTLTVRGNRTDGSQMGTIDIKVAQQYLKQLESLGEGNNRSIDITSLVHLPGVLASADEEGHRRESLPVLERLVESACSELDVMRRREGAALLEELERLLADIETNMQVVRDRSPVVVEAYQERLRKRMDMLLASSGNTASDEDLLREVAIFAEKSDITEEVARMAGHLQQFRELIGQDELEPVGRTLDFLAQEMLREANTIGSKCLDSEVSRYIVLIKGAIDRLKEQVQNVQ